jgi:predicted N-acetyltransferase YhbS
VGGGQIMETINLEFYTNANITDQQMVQICLFKNKIWEYNLESQKNWLKNNLLTDDIHFILKIGNKIIAYMNLSEVIINEINIEAIGIGNVSVLKEFRDQGIGSQLMSLAYSEIIRDKPTILLCNQNLIAFYKSLGWQQYSGKVIINEKTIKSMLMYKNLDIKESQISLNREV